MKFIKDTITGLLGIILFPVFVFLIYLVIHYFIMFLEICWMFGVNLLHKLIQ